MSAAGVGNYLMSSNHLPATLTYIRCTAAVREASVFIHFRISTRSQNALKSNEEMWV